MVRVPVLLLLLASLQHTIAADSYATQWRLVLPWADAPADQSTPPAVYNGDRIIAFAGLDGGSWTLVASSATGPSAGQLLWTTKLPLGSSLPSVVAVAGDLAVMELDGRVFAVHPGNGSLAWNATSPCSLGDPRMVNSRDAYDAVYLVCNELSGDSSVVALSPSDGSTAWALSTSAVASKLTPVRAAVAAPGMFVYADSGSVVTALGAGDGALLWQVDVGRLPNTTVTTTVTHLQLAGDTLLVREFSAGLNFTQGPASYLALQLNGTRAPALLWAAASPEQRDQLPAGVTEASPVVAPSLSWEDDLFYYWAAEVVAASPPPPAPPLPPPAPPASPPPPPTAPAPGMAAQWIQGGDGGSAAALDVGAGGEVASSRSAAGGGAAGRRLSQAAAPGPAGPADGLITPSAQGSQGLDLVLGSPPAAPAPSPPAAPAAAPGPLPAPANAGLNNASAVVPPPVAVETGGVGVVAPEGLASFPVLKARFLSTGLEAWRLRLTPVSAPSATSGAVAVVTPEGLRVLGAAAGSLAWAVEQAPLGIYPYAAAAVGADAVAVRNCLNTLAPNSLCIYSQAPAAAGEQQAPAQASPPGGEAAGPAGGTSGGRSAAAALAALLACAAAALLML